MGFCMSCCKKSDTHEYQTVDNETRRQVLAEAAERRQHQQESRGITDVSRVRQHQERWKKVDEALEQGSNVQGHLRWQVG